MRSKFALVLVVSVVAAMLAPLTAVAAEDPVAEDPVWSFTGAGWGHGVGMSQYGAYGMALDGADAAEIIEHYYSGAYLGDLGDRTLPSWWSDPYPLLVGLEQDVNEVTLGAVGGPVELCHLKDDSTPCTPTTVPAGTTVVVSGGGDECSVAIGGGAAGKGTCMIDVEWDQQSDTRLAVGAIEYAHGELRIRPDGYGELNVILEIELELYLRGIAEMPGSWPSSALAAQAIAARNYAVRRVLDTSTASGDPTRACGCHLYDTIYDQVYLGWSKEGISDDWVDAVEATQSSVAIHPSTNLVFTAYYSSSSGGATENNESVWGGSPLQFLRSVSDPWSISGDVANPYAAWEASFTSSKIESILGWDELTGVELVHGPPGAVVRFTGVDGEAAAGVEYQGDALRRTFDLRSPWVSGVTSPYTPFQFQDVTSSVHQAGIAYISDLGITQGCNPPANDRFCPEETVTRGQMAAFLVRALNLPAAEPGGFADTAASVFVGDIDRLVAAGITKGCNPPDNDRYCPDDPVSRGAMAAFLVRAFDFPVEEGSDFLDDDGSDFEADIERLAAAGVTKGCNPPAGDRFCPDQAITRGEMATFLMRALQTLDG